MLQPSINLLSLFLSLLSLFSPASSYKIDSTKHFFKDEHNRTMIFHGVNIVVKLPPYIPSTDAQWDPLLSFNSIDIAYLKQFGFNLVRLGIIWESIEKAEGYYDEAHLNKMSALVKQLEDNNIAVIIDAHQDMFSRTFCGEGVPHFYAKKLHYETTCSRNAIGMFFQLIDACRPLSIYNWDYDDNGLPLISDCRKKGNFIQYHQSPELASIYNSFYRNQNGIIDAFASFWKTLARTFANRANVLGYDLWNEPWANNIWSDLTAFIPGRRDRNEVTRLYQTVDRAISEVDDDYTLFFESIPFPDILPLFGGRILPGFKLAPIDNHKRAQVYNTHNYCCSSSYTMCLTGEPPLYEAMTHCRRFHKRKMKDNLSQAKAMGVPLFVTEFGSCGDSEACYQEMLGFVEAADENLVGWAYWMYKPFNDHTTTTESVKEGLFNQDGSIQEVKEKALTRSYVQAFQGYPLKMKYDDTTKQLSASFILDTDIKAPSLIYLNKQLNYPNGYYLKVLDSSGKELSPEVIAVDDNHFTIFFASYPNTIIVHFKLTSKAVTPSINRTCK